MFTKDQIPLRDVIASDMPRSLPQFDQFVAKAADGTIASKYQLAAAMFSLVAHPLYSQSLRHLTEGVAYKTMGQVLALLQDGIAQNHADSIYTATYATIAVARTPQDMDKAYALYEKIRNSPDILAEEKVELEKVLKRNRRDIAAQPPQPPSPPVP